MTPEDEKNRSKRAVPKLSVDEAILKTFGGRVPRHVAIIMDGNGRWAQQRDMRRLRGHRAGASAVRSTVEACRYLGVEYLTLYAFSAQNWERPQDEVLGLMTLFDLYIRRERNRLIENEIAVHLIGERQNLSARLQSAIAALEAATQKDPKMILQVAVSYGGREEIVRAARGLAEQCARGELDPADINDEVFESQLFTTGVPDPDLIIRTSGEFRVSNFLLWQIAYSEFYISPVLWPDFNERELIAAFESFSQRERRFGKTGAQVQAPHELGGLVLETG